MSLQKRTDVSTYMCSIYIYMLIYATEINYLCFLFRKKNSPQRNVFCFIYCPNTKNNATQLY